MNSRLPRFPEEKHLAQSLKTLAAQERYERLAIGKEIRAARKRAGMKQTALALKLKTSQSAVARMEAGNQNFSLGMLVRIARALGAKLSVAFTS